MKQTDAFASQAKHAKQQKHAHQIGHKGGIDGIV